jgi:CHAT domain-containing protein/tetratricopeptide (TPR) repeat protein
VAVGLLAALALLAGDAGPSIDALLARAEALVSPQQRRADLAAPLFVEAARRAEDERDVRRAARAWLGLGKALRSTHQPSEARDAADRARAAFAASGDVAGEADALRLIAALLQESGDFESGDRVLKGLLDLARRTANAPLQIRALNGLSASERRQGRLFEAVAHARQALDELDHGRARGDSVLGSEVLFAVPYNLGSSLLESGDYRGAIGLLQRALAAADAAGNLAGRWHVLQDTAAWYQAQGDLGKAAAYYERALEAARSVESRDPEALTLRGLASVAEARGDLGEARRRYADALAVFERIGFGSELAATLVALGRVEGLLGETEASRASLGSAVAVAGSTGQPLAAVLAHLERARQDEAAGRSGPAAAAYRIALATARVNGLRPLEPVALVGLAGLLRKEGERALALRHYEEAAAAVEAMRTRIPSIDLRAAFAAAAHDTYAGLLALTLQASPPGGAGDGRVLLVLERERSHGLVEGLRQSGAEGAPAVGGEMRELRRQVSAIQLRLTSPETGASERSALLARLDDAERALDALEGQTQRALAWSAPADVPALRAVLREGEAFVAYALLPEGAVALVVTSTELRLVPLQAGTDLDARIDLYVRLLAGPSPEDALPAGRALCRVLLDPVLRGLPSGTRRLIVSSTGTLASLPFGSLPDPARPEAPLVARLAIAYAPSLSALARLRSSPRSGGRGVLAVAGDVPERPAVMFAGRLRSLALLPGARREIEAIAGRASPVEVLSGRAAGEAALRSRRLRGFSVLHFAAHAVEDPLAPSRSALLLAPGGGEDGWLQAREIYDLDLDADLVILSGCATAAGRVSVAEGIRGLSLAFLYAGARAAIATAWKVEDQATARLVDDIYRRLVAGDDVGDALASAQRAAAAGPRPWARAGDWAGFVVHGDPAARPSLSPAVPGLAAEPRVALAVLAAAAALLLLLRARSRASTTIRPHPMKRS